MSPVNSENRTEVIITVISHRDVLTKLLQGFCRKTAFENIDQKDEKVGEVKSGCGWGKYGEKEKGIGKERLPMNRKYAISSSKWLYD